MNVRLFLLIGMTLSITIRDTHAQSGQGQLELPYHQIYAYGMDANIRPALAILRDFPVHSDKDLAIQQQFIERFGGAKDMGSYDSSGDAEMDELMGYFRKYWRASLLDPATDYEKALRQQIIPFLTKHYPPFKGPLQRFRLDAYLADYIRSKGYYTTDQINSTGRLLDMLVWKKRSASRYRVKLSEAEEIDVNVVMMDDFITLGWMEYATLGKHYPGGWATDNTLFCVKPAYELDSEDFRVSYLAHEARHLKDKQVFPYLSSQDLEYRAKLTELSLAQSRLFDLIEFFIQNSNSYSSNGHQRANHRVIKDLSAVLFDQKFERDMDQWRQIEVSKINNFASLLLKKDSNRLKRSFR